MPEPDLLVRAMGSLHDGVMVTDAEERIVAVNDAICAMTGYSREELVGATCALIQGPQTQPDQIEAMRHAVATGEHFVGELFNYRKDGTPYWNGLSIAPVWRDGGITHFVSMQRDITMFVAKRTALDSAHTTTAMMFSVARALSGPNQGRDVAQIIADAVPTVLGCDRSTVLLWDAVTRRFVMAAASGWDGEAGEQVSRWVGTRVESPDLATIMDSGRPALLPRSSPWARALMEQFHFNGIAVAPITVSGRLLGAISGQWSRTSPPVELDATLNDRMTGLAGLAGVALDQTRLQEAIDWGSRHDPVTSLPNRRMLEEHITRELEDLAQRGGYDVTVLACDVDRFTRISDAYPTAIVDSLLREMAARIKSSLGADGFVARLGADDFVMVLRGFPEDIEAAAARLFDAFIAPFAVGDDTIHAGISIGGAVSADVSAPADGHAESAGVSAAQRLVSLAVADLNARKGDRGAGLLPTDPEEARLDTDLRSAVGNGEIAVHYQPQIRVSDGALVGVEALVRWNHPALGPISPVRFIPLAEFNGVIREIGRFVLETACADAARWGAAGHPIEVSVNVAVHQLEDPAFADSVVKAVSSAGLPPERLTLEVTETRLVSDRSVAQAQLRQLCDLGYAISVDDFGTGFSSLTQLSNMPVDELKIDRSFIARITGDGRPMVAGVIGLAKGLQLRVVAEGVEDGEQLTALQELHCDRAQGFHIGRPMSTVDLERDWMSDRA